MGYPTIDKPYGLKPVNAQGGRQYAGSTRMIPIANGLASNLLNGDVVGMGAGVLAATSYSGTANSATAGAGVGVFVGCEYSTPGGVITGKNRYNAYIATQTANDAVGYVVDDPLALFRVAVLTQGTTSVTNTPGATIGYMNPAFVGSNAYLITGNSGSTTTGVSAMGVSGGVVTNGTGNTRNILTATPFRIVQVVPDTAYTYLSTSTSTTSSGTSMTISAADANIKAGMQFVAVASNGTYVSGCAPGNYNTVTNNNGTTTITLSGSIGASLSGATLTFIGYPEVIIGWQPTYHSYNITTGV